MGTLGQVEVAHAPLKGGTTANAVNSFSPLWSTVANANAVFTRCCDMIFGMRHPDATANVVNSRSSLRPTVANAHATYAGPFELKFLMRQSAAALESSVAVGHDFRVGRWWSVFGLLSRSWQSRSPH